MLDKNHLAEIISLYKQDFESFVWEKENYKWEAIKQFQNNWNIDAEDFFEMLHQSLSKTYNLLDSSSRFPRRMIELFTRKSPEKLRAMFRALYDESKGIYERIEIFKNKSSDLLEKYGDGALQHYQDENTISVYLWLRFPDKYYIYKLGVVKAISAELDSSYSFKKGAYQSNIENSQKLYAEIREQIKEDTELQNLVHSHLLETYYKDPQLITLTSDLGYYIFRYYPQLHGEEQLPTDEWYPSDYEPGLTKDEWLKLLKDKKVFDKTSLEIMYRMKDYGGQATCTQLSTKYGESIYFYRNGSKELGKRIHQATNCPIKYRDNSDSPSWWPILYVGKSAGTDEDGAYIWKLRKELSDALDNIDFSSVKLYADEDNEDNRQYWWLNANPKIWRVSSIAVGGVQSYTLYNDNGNKRRVFQNFIDVKAGDPVIGYESNPVKQIVALAKIHAGSDGQKIYIEKTEGLSTPIDYQTVKNCPELSQMEFFKNPNGSLFKLSKGEYDFLMDMIRDENPLVQESSIPTYSKQDFLNEVYMSNESYDRLVSVLDHKLNIILQGAPGVGKTFAAKRLAWSIMGEKDDTRIEFVQFHQNYSYEDFVMGYKPDGNTFELKKGIFYKFCQKAANQPDKKFFFIIDEINRGNLSKIFGELLMLIEKDYRSKEAVLAYDGIPFSVPRNLYIIGMMNTADRSLALIDYALRRRFSFIDMEPAFDSNGFKAYQNMLGNETFNDLIKQVQLLNQNISDDKSLGKGFCIGHSYFCGQDKSTCTDTWMESVIDFDIIPMLREYWFDDDTKVQYWDNILHGVFQ